MVSARAMMLIGAGCAAIGCFLPFATMPFIGTVDYFLNGHGDGLFVVGIAALVFLFALISGTWGAAKVTAMIGGLAIGCLLVFFQSRIAAAIEQIRSAAADSSRGLFGGLAEGLANAIHLDFGYYVVAAGAVLMFLGGIVGVARAVGKPEYAPVVDESDKAASME